MRLLSLLMFFTISCQHSNSTTKNNFDDDWQDLVATGTLDLEPNGENESLEGVWDFDEEQGLLVTIANDDEKKIFDLKTKELYLDFIIEFEFALSDGGNSGIKYYVDNSLPAVGLEYQIIDSKHKDSKLPRRKTASLYDLFPAKGAELKPIGEFNKAKIIANAGNIQHWLNGELVLEANIDGDDFSKAKKRSKFEELDGFAYSRPSIVVLQHHGEVVSFRNVRIRHLID